MKLRDLEWALQEVGPFKQPKVDLEQYPTTPHLAARVVYNAAVSYGDIAGKRVLDLGCGPGILSIASKLMDSAYTLGIDIDADALVTAQENAADFGVDVDFLQANVAQLDLLGRGEHPKFHLFDTVLMNPPFGTKPGNKGIDMIFLEAALRRVTSEGAVYSMHKTSTRGYILKKAESWGVNVQVLAIMNFEIRNIYKFHKKKSVDVSVDLLRFQKQDSGEEAKLVAREVLAKSTDENIDVVSTSDISATLIEAHIILFYIYFSATEAVDEAFCEKLLQFQKELCRRCQLLGRVLVSVQGVNGTLSGRKEDIDVYKAVVSSWEYRNVKCFGNIDWKHSTSAIGEEPFPDLVIRAVNELVASGDMIYDIHEHGGEHLSPEEFHSILAEAPEDLVLLDVRNRFEYSIGHFIDKKGRVAMDPNMRNFTQFKHFIDEVGPTLLKDKRVLMYCTGGIRCETASAYVNSKGYAKQVGQLSGGIHRYCEVYGGEGYFKGKNFVFDRRIAMETSMSPKVSSSSELSSNVVGKCTECGCVFDQLRAGVVCTVCVCLVLVCDKCLVSGRPMYETAPLNLRKRKEWYCKEHGFLRGIFFTFLEQFDEGQLVKQKDELHTLLLKLESETRLRKLADEGDCSQRKLACGGKKHKQRKKEKNTDPKQRALILKRQLKRVEDQVLKLQSAGFTPLGDDVPLPCRCCMKPNCNGHCWGYWKAPNVGGTEKST